MSLRTLLSRWIELLTPGSSLGQPLEILEETDDALCVLLSGNRMLLAHRPSRQLRIVEGATLAGFDDIRSFEVGPRTAAGEGGSTTTWALSLHLKNGRCIDLGESDSDVDASIAAARLAGFTGQKVQHPHVRFPL